jgi:hypothetical protein
MSLFDDASLVLTPNGVKSGKVYSIKPTDGVGDFDFTRASSATRVNSDGLIETVSTGVPRLDYPPLGGCPSLLLEPERTNLLTYSEEFDNAAWVKGNTTVTANVENSPDGTLNADTMTFTDSLSRVQATLALGAGTYTFSCYVKKLSTTSGSTMRLRVGFDGSGEQIIFTPTEEWVRYSYTFTATSEVNAAQIRSVNLIGEVAIWGAQLEVGSSPTSYIPTVASTVTRVAEACSKTGLSDLIGQTEGTLYAEVDIQKDVIGVIAVIDDGSVSDFIAIQRRASREIRVQIRSAGGSIVTIITSSPVSIGSHKIALTYTNGDYVLYVDGAIAGTSTNSTDYPATTLTQLVLSSTSYGPLNDSIRAAAIYTTRLSNAELESLTTL